MESLLRWGITNSTPGQGSQEPPRPLSELDPGVIDAILGKSDAELMKEALTVAVDEKRDEDDRIQALDDFEMLIEQIDNSNNLEKLRMWEPLQALLVNPSSSEAIQMQTLWVLGTAVQNNPAAQHAYLTISPLRDLLTFLAPSVRSSKTRSKAVYALSGLLKHNAAAVARMEDAGGWDVLREALQDSDIGVRRKVAFLLATLLIPTAVPIPAERQAAAENPPIPASASVSAPQSQALAVHPSTSTVSPSSPQPSSATTADVSPPQTVHPNSHASMVADPSSFATSPPTVRALAAHGLLAALVSALASPLPHGPDGDCAPDADFEEKVLHALHTYVDGCGGNVDGEEREALGKWLRERREKAGGEDALAAAWGMTRDEVRDLLEATA